jgi:hypothetical protein
MSVFGFAVERLFDSGRSQGRHIDSSPYRQDLAKTAWWVCNLNALKRLSRYISSFELAVMTVSERYALPKDFV